MKAKLRPADFRGLRSFMTMFFRSGLPIVTTAVPDMEHMYRRTLNGEEDPPRCSTPVQQLPNLTVKGFAFWGNHMGLGKGRQFGNSAADSGQPLGCVNRALSFQPVKRHSDILAGKGRDDHPIALHASLKPGLLKKAPASMPSPLRA